MPARGSDGDLGSLGDTFNKMTAQLEAQRNELLAAKRTDRQRRRFTEAVLAGVTAGVIGVDADGRVTIVNRSALRLARRRPRTTAIGRPLVDVLPQLGAGAGEARRDGRGRSIATRSPSSAAAASARSTCGHDRARGRPASHGYVVTLDDITDLVAAQRSSAWADVARRIAHEIKNPLTPIQLSAERLAAASARSITEDREVFDQCTDTIIRQVGDIGRMVDEFSSFARMPKPAMRDAQPVASRCARRCS